ncbi:hypothetical protein [Loigolactobacillus coryniformis]|uniref:hypothetical protein n=1 Tax=Loigolactobacillus coryniformis TaxID=1610 RepID=UPI00021949B8|nr:hypothetical protein [Loigolactobacillus coryniformis]
MTLDTNVVHYLLQHPAAIKTVTIAPEWFSGKSCREFVEFMVTDPGPFQSFCGCAAALSGGVPAGV